jgi:AraC family transcriptional regulator
MTSNLIRPLELNQRLTNKSLVLSSRHLDWNGILLEQYQSLSTPSEIELPALSDHWLTLHMGHPVHLTQNHDDRLHESIVQKGDSIFVPAGQPSYRCRRGDSSCSLHILLKPELIEQVAEASEIDRERLDLVNRFAKQDLQLHHVAMLLLAELHSARSSMGRLKEGVRLFPFRLNAVRCVDDSNFMKASGG